MFVCVCERACVSDAAVPVGKKRFKSFMNPHFPAFSPEIHRETLAILIDIFPKNIIRIKS